MRAGQPVFLAVLLLVSNCVVAAGQISTNEFDQLKQEVAKLHQEGKYAEALPLALHALDIAVRNDGSNAFNIAIGLNWAAALYECMGDYSKAEPFYRRAVTILEKAAGPDHPNTATSLNNLGKLYMGMGDQAKAEPLLQRGLKIHEKVLSPNHPDIALDLDNLGMLYMNMGDYAKAEAFLQRSLRICEKGLGSDRPEIARCFNDLALFYNLMRDYAKAEPLFQRSLKIYEKLFGPNHPYSAFILNNLGLVYQNMGDYAKAESFFQRSLKICEKALGSDHPNTATNVNNLGSVYQNMGDYAKAESFLQRGLKLREKVLAPDHPDIAISLNNLGALYMFMGDYAKAEPLYLRGLKIYVKVFGPDHPSTAVILSNFELSELKLGRSDVAMYLAVKQRTASEKNLGRILAFTSDRQRMAYQRDNSSNDLLAILGSAPDLAEGLLRTKGVVLDSLLEDQLVAEASKDPEIKSVVDQLRVAGRRLIQLQMEVPKDISASALKRRQTERESLGQQVEDLQKALARNVATVGQVRRALRIKTSDVQTVLPKNTVLMEFVRYNHNLGKGKSEFRYGAVLIGNPQMTFKDAKPGEPVWVPLGPAKAIEQNLKEYVARMRGDIKGETNLLHKLYTQLFEPIQKRLPKDITTLIISPDAELNFVSFATFVDDQDKFLAEKFTLNYMASGRDLVLKRTAKTKSQRFAAFANPAFGEKPLMAGTHGSNTVQLAMLSSDLRDYRGEILKPLPYTMQEAQFLHDRSSSWNMEGSVYAGAEASEAEVKAVKSPYILHLATHGFFLPDTMTTNSTTGRQMTGNDRAPIVPHNPMQRSGLAFAGAQLTLDAWKKGETPDTENDGILMGQEIGTMDLKETWLVVLSACDTGIGEARAGEGVLGLRRGFIQAGAQNLLMTLWPVSDQWTVDLMKAFYERALKDNNAPQALAEVQRDFLVKIKNETKNAVIAARLAGPFVMTFQGRN